MVVTTAEHSLMAQNGEQFASTANNSNCEAISSNSELKMAREKDVEDSAEKAQMNITSPQAVSSQFSGFQNYASLAEKMQTFEDEESHDQPIDYSLRYSEKILLNKASALCNPQYTAGPLSDRTITCMMHEGVKPEMSGACGGQQMWMTTTSPSKSALPIDASLTHHIHGEHGSPIITAADSNPNDFNAIYDSYAETDLDQPTNYSLVYNEDMDTTEDYKMMKRPKEAKKFSSYSTTDDLKNLPFSGDTVKVYCTEDTPLNFSTASSFTDLREITANMHADLAAESSADSSTKDVKADLSFEENDTLIHLEDKEDQNKKVSPGKEISPGKLQELADHPVAEKCTSVLKRRTAQQEKESKTVTFGEEVNYAEETPLMFSRCSSLGSLSSFDQHSIHDDRSSVISDFSRQTSEAVSPSDLPDSPTQTIPPSPQGRSRPVFIFTSKTPNEDHGDVIRPKPLVPMKKVDIGSHEKTTKQQSVFEDSKTMFAEEGEYSRSTSLSSLVIDDETGKLPLHLEAPHAKGDDNKSKNFLDKVEEEALAVDTLDENVLTECGSDGVTECCQNSDLDESSMNEKDEDETTIEVPDPHEEALIRACINAGMPKSSSSSYRFDEGRLNSKMSNLSLSGNKVEASIIPLNLSNGSSAKQVSSPPNSHPLPVTSMTPFALRPQMKQILSYSPSNFYQQDTIKVYNSEGTPSNLSHATSLSDLSILSIDDVNKKVDIGAFLQDEKMPILDNNMFIHSGASCRDSLGQNSSSGFGDDLQNTSDSTPKSKILMLKSQSLGFRNGTLMTMNNTCCVPVPRVGGVGSYLYSPKGKLFEDPPGISPNLLRQFASGGGRSDFCCSMSSSAISSACDSPHVYNVEGTPVVFSRNDSLSSISCDDDDDDMPHLEDNNNNGKLEDSSCNKKPCESSVPAECELCLEKQEKTCPLPLHNLGGQEDETLKDANISQRTSSPLNIEKENTNDARNSDNEKDNDDAPISKSPSLSTLSIGSVEEFSTSEMALLEQCILAGMPKDRPKSGAKSSSFDQSCIPGNGASDDKNDAGASKLNMMDSVKNASLFAMNNETPLVRHAVDESKHHPCASDKPHKYGDNLRCSTDQDGQLLYNELGTHSPKVKAPPHSLKSPCGSQTCSPLSSPFKSRLPNLMPHRHATEIPSSSKFLPDSSHSSSSRLSYSPKKHSSACHPRSFPICQQNLAEKQEGCKYKCSLKTGSNQRTVGSTYGSVHSSSGGPLAQQLLLHHMKNCNTVPKSLGSSSIPGTGICNMQRLRKGSEPHPHATEGQKMFNEPKSYSSQSSPRGSFSPRSLDETKEELSSSEQALLKLCIDAGMPKSRQSSQKNEMLKKGKDVAGKTQEGESERPVTGPGANPLARQDISMNQLSNKEQNCKIQEKNKQIIETSEREAGNGRASMEELSSSEQILLDQLINTGMPKAKQNGSERWSSPRQEKVHLDVTDLKLRQESSEDLSLSEAALLEQCISAGMPKIRCNEKHLSTMESPRKKIQDCLLQRPITGPGMQNPTLCEQSCELAHGKGQPKIRKEKPQISKIAKFERTVSGSQSRGLSSDCTSERPAANGVRMSGDDDLSTSEQTLLDQLIAAGMPKAKGSSKKASSSQLPRPDRMKQSRNPQPKAVEPMKEMISPSEQALPEHCINAGMPREQRHNVNQKNESRKAQESTSLRPVTGPGSSMVSLQSQSLLGESPPGNTLEKINSKIKKSKGTDDYKLLSSGPNLAEELSSSEEALLEQLISAGMPKPRENNSSDLKNGHNQLKHEKDDFERTRQFLRPSGTFELRMPDKTDHRNKIRTLMGFKPKSYSTPESPVEQSRRKFCEKTYTTACNRFPSESRKGFESSLKKPVHAVENQMNMFYDRNDNANFGAIQPYYRNNANCNFGKNCALQSKEPHSQNFNRFTCGPRKSTAMPHPHQSLSMTDDQKAMLSGKKVYRHKSEAQSRQPSKIAMHRARASPGIASPSSPQTPPPYSYSHSRIPEKRTLKPVGLTNATLKMESKNYRGNFLFAGAFERKASYSSRDASASQNSSPSNTSTDSVDELSPSEQALLEKCISAGMPKGRERKMRNANGS